MQSTKLSYFMQVANVFLWVITDFVISVDNVLSMHCDTWCEEHNWAFDTSILLAVQADFCAQLLSRTWGAHHCMLNSVAWSILVAKHGILW